MMEEPLAVFARKKRRKNPIGELGAKVLCYRMLSEADGEPCVLISYELARELEEFFSFCVKSQATNGSGSP